MLKNRAPADLKSHDGSAVVMQQCYDGSRSVCCLTARTLTAFDL